MKNFAMDSAALRAAQAAGHEAEIFRRLARYGITFDARLGKVGFLKVPASEIEFHTTDSGTVVCDAQPELVTVPSAGIPAWLTNYFDPRIIEILQAPLEAVEIIGSEVQKGDWTTTYATFLSVERTGQVSSYGDFSNNGTSGANLNFPDRQSYLYQIFTNWGELQMARAANAKVNWANEVSEGSIRALNQFQNASYFYGISGLLNYGLLNDPSLYAPIAPTLPWNASATTAEQIYEDIRRMFVQLQNQSNGLIKQKDKITLAMSPTLEVALAKTNQFGINVSALIKLNFPGLTVKTAVQYQTAAGQLVQMIVDNVRGQRTMEAAFNAKMHAHAVIPGPSSWSQKKSQGTFGSVIYTPIAISQLLGA